MNLKFIAIMELFISFQCFFGLDLTVSYAAGVLEKLRVFSKHCNTNIWYMWFTFIQIFSIVKMELTAQYTILQTEFI